MSDIVFMKKALKLAARGKGRTSPNPAVGAVIVKEGNVIGEGYHKKAGTPHAEIIALEMAGSEAKGATMYVTLEPCCHTGKKTPPCTRAIIRTSVRKVVAAVNDPNPLVSGKGIRELQKAGIETEVGIMKAEALKLNEAFVKFITRKEPFVILKIAQSLDGKIATAKGESKWITGEKARGHVHRLRNEVDALLVGAGTVQKDNPSLDCRIRGGRNPYRVIVDSALRISARARVFNYNDNKTIIATTNRANPSKMDRLVQRGVQVLVVKSSQGKVDLKALMKKLGRMDITSLLIEGGSSVSAAALSCNIVDKVMFFIAPKIIGGTDSYPSVGGKSPDRLIHATRLRDLRSVKTGEDILLEAYIA